MDDPAPSTAIAVVGLSCRFPGADSPEAYWDNLAAGHDGVSDLAPSAAAASSPPGASRVWRWGVLEDCYGFDAGYFGMSPREAEITDPQHRLLLELAVEALDRAGYGARASRPRTGLFAAVGTSGYEAMVLSAEDLVAAVGEMAINIGNAPEHIGARVAHKLDLHGPIATVQTACSSALVAVHQAASALLAGECDLVLAGGVSMRLPQEQGYLHTPGGIGSPDGRTRSFDADAAGTVGGNGGGLVALRRLDDALAAGDAIHAVLLGSAVNNDGARRAGYTAPSVDGQAGVIRDAQDAAGIDPWSVGFVECHGSGTPLGDAIELAALRAAFGPRAAGRTCLVGSAKSNLGHLREAAGIAGLIKAVLAVEKGEVPPTLHIRSPNADLLEARHGFAAATTCAAWPGEGVRRAGVNSFGLGGTNAHVVLQQPPPRPAVASPGPEVLILSARSEESLSTYRDTIAERLEQTDGPPLADLAYVLQDGREEHRSRLAVVASTAGEAAALLRKTRPPRAKAASSAAGAAFLIAGTGDSYEGVAADLYRRLPLFRAAMDECLDLLQPMLGRDLRTLSGLTTSRSVAAPSDLRALFRAARGGPAKAETLTLAEQHCFDFSLALARGRTWMDLGVLPRALIGYSLGEYVAATLAGVFDLEAALRLVSGRAALIEACAPGGMLTICLESETLAARMPDGVSIAAETAANVTLVAGDDAALDGLQADLHSEGVAFRRLPARRAIHTPLMASAAGPLERLVSEARPRSPRLPIVSNVTGDWIGGDEMSDGRYWSQHLCGPVRLASGFRRLEAQGLRRLVELGAGQGLSTGAVQAIPDGLIVSSLPSVHDPRADLEVLLAGAARLWTSGLAIRWAAVRNGPRGRTPSPGAPWTRVAHGPPGTSRPQRAPSSVSRRVPAPTPAGGLADRLADMFTRLTGAPDVVGDSNFFEIGGTSLLALQLVLHIVQDFGCEVALPDIYEDPTPCGVARVVERALRAVVA